VVTYYLIIIVPQGFVYSRFLFPPLAMLAVLVGVAGHNLLRTAAIPMQARLAAVTLVAALTLGYAVAVDAEMLTDSRYRVEQWFKKNVPADSSVGAFSKPQYLPRLPELGYATYGVEMSREALARPQPDYLVLTSYHYQDFDDAQRSCMQALVRGEFDYEPAITFRGRYLGTGSSWLSLAGWGAPVPGQISPTITIMKRKTP
jgi:hypothetical protein